MSNNLKSLFKYKHGDDLGFMHYVVFNGEVVVLSAHESLKVSHIEKHGYLDVTFDVKSDSYGPVKASVSTDKEYVQQVYNYMIETNNAYFKDGIEGLCVVKFEK